MKSTHYTWEQIVDILIEEYQSNSMEKDQKLPTENELSVCFCVPRTVIRKSYEKLKELGYIYSLRGYGSYFKGKNQKILLDLNNDSSFSEKMWANGYDYHAQNIGCEKIDKSSIIYQTMHALPSEEIYCISLLRLIDNEPVAIHSSYLSTKYFPELAQNGSSILSVYDYMHSYNFYSFSRSEMEMNVTLLSEKQRNLLHISGYETALTLNSQCIHQPSGELLELSKILYRCDKFSFIL